MDLVATISVTLIFIGLAWLLAWRLSRPYPRENDAYQRAEGDIPTIPTINRPRGD